MSLKFPLQRVKAQSTCAWIVRTFCLTLVVVLISNLAWGQTPPKQVSTQDMIKAHLEVGDRFLAMEQYLEARRDYEEALRFDPNNLEVLERLITLYVKSPGYLCYDRNSVYPKDREECPPILTYLFRIYALNPSKKNDVDFLLQEAQVLNRHKDAKGAVEAVLMKVHTLAPNDPVVLAELGRTQALMTKDAKESKDRKGIDLIKQAIAIDPKVKYYEYLADALRWFGQDTEAVREYMKILQRLKKEDPSFDPHNVPEYSVSDHSARRAIQLFHKNLGKEGKGRKIQFALDMNVKEQISALEFLTEFNLWFYDSGRRGGTSVYPMKWLARLYAKEGIYEKADQVFTKYMKKSGYDYYHYRFEKKELEFFQEILTDGKHNPEKLKKIRQAFEDRFGEKEIQPAKKQRG